MPLQGTLVQAALVRGFAEISSAKSVLWRRRICIPSRQMRFIVRGVKFSSSASSRPLVKAAKDDERRGKMESWKSGEEPTENPWSHIPIPGRCGPPAEQLSPR